MNRLQLARTVMKQLAKAAREAQFQDKKRILQELKDDVENLWHLLADMRERNVLSPEMYHRYVLHFVTLRKTIAQKEAQYS